MEREKDTSVPGLRLTTSYDGSSNLSDMDNYVGQSPLRGSLSSFIYAHLPASLLALATIITLWLGLTLSARLTKKARSFLREVSLSMCTPPSTGHYMRHIPPAAVRKLLFATSSTHRPSSHILYGYFMTRRIGASRTSA